MTKRMISLAALAATVLSLGLAAGAAAQVRVGANYRLNDDPSAFRAVDQIGLAVHRTNLNHVVAVNANYLDLRCEASRSLDGGVTWSTAVPLIPPAAAALSARCAFHQSVEFGSGQNVYAIVTANKTNTSSPDASVVVYKSADGGLTWAPGVVVMEGGAGTNDPVPSPSTGPSYTRPDLAVVPGGGTAGADLVYAVARDFIATGNGSCGGPCDVVRVATSLDSGATYTQKTNASASGVDAADPVPAVINSDNSITLAWRTTGVTGILQAARSTNQGTSWSSPANIANVNNSGTSTATHVPPTPPATTGASSTSAFPRMASDPNIAGRVYIVYSNGPSPAPTGFRGSDHFINPKNDVWFQRSSDFGTTWTAPKRISDPTTYPGSMMIQTRQPNLSVSPNGRVNIVWHDRRHWYQAAGEHACSHSHTFCEDIRLGDTYYSYSTNGGTDFSPNIRINDRSHNNDTGYDTRPASGYWSWGPQVVTVADDKVLVGWMDSREGNWDTDTEDFYLAKVDFAATGAAPRTFVDQPDAISRSIALSKLGYPAGNEGALVGGVRDPANILPTPLASPPGGPASRNASSVVIANETDLASAAAGAVLARANPGPVLLSAAAGLSAAVKAEITRIRPARVFLIGDATKLSATVATDAQVAGNLLMTSVIRVAGANDADTAAQIAALMDDRTTTEKDNTNPALRPAFDAAVIANPASPDIAAAVALAAARRLPILWVGQNSVPAETTAALGTTALDIDKTLVIGPESSVSASVASGLPTSTRRGGADIYATSQAVVTESKARGLPSNIVYVADGAKPIDAALLGAVVARATGMFLLAPAPLYDTAAAQAASFGVTGIDRLFAVGPAAAPPPPPPPPPPPVVPPPVAPPPAVPPPVPDVLAPTAKLSGPTIQKLGLSASLTVQCISEACKAAVAGTIQVPKVGRIAGKTYKLKSVTASINKGAKRKFALKLSAIVRAAIKRAQKARKVVSVKFTIKVSDTAGNSRSLKRTVRLKR